MLRTSRTPLLVGAAAGLVLGLILGLVFGWLVWPVKWTNLHTYDLPPEARAQYVALLSDSVQPNEYLRAKTILDNWPDKEREQAFTDAITAAAAQGQPDKARALQDLQTAVRKGPLPAPSPTVQPVGLVERVRVPCLVFLVVLLLLVLGWIGLRLFLGRKSSAQTTTDRSGPAPVAPPSDEPAVTGERTPLGQWITTYKLGEDAYDESYPIETSSGEYLGECGVGISEVLGTGEPGKVTAFEVWLFDKGDIRTVTKVLMSEYAFHDDALRAKLASKGEAVLVQVGTPLALETTGLQVQANVTELEYGKGDPEPNSFFSKLTVELSAAGKPAASETEPVQ